MVGTVPFPTHSTFYITAVLDVPPPMPDTRGSTVLYWYFEIQVNRTVGS